LLTGSLIQNLPYNYSQSNLYRPWEIEGDPDNDRAKKAYESVLTVTASSSRDSDNYESFEKSVKELSKEKFNYNYDEPVNNFVANFHDAVRDKLYLYKLHSYYVIFKVVGRYRAGSTLEKYRHSKNVLIRL